MKLRTSFGTALAAAAGVLTLAAGPAMAATTAHQAPAAAQASARVATHLTIAASHTWITAGQTITLTAHLDKHGTNRTVTVYGQDWAGGARYVVATGAVNKAGNFSVQTRNYQNHTFWATFSGGSAYAPSTANGVAVHVATQVTAALSNYYTTTTFQGHQVRVFHKSKNVFVNGSVSPNKGTAAIDIEYYNFKTKTWAQNDSAPAFRLGSNGNYSLNIGTDPLATAEFRVLISEAADARDGAGNSGWLYLTATN